MSSVNSLHSLLLLILDVDASSFDDFFLENIEDKSDLRLTIAAVVFFTTKSSFVTSLVVLLLDSFNDAMLSVLVDSSVGRVTRSKVSALTMALTMYDLPRINLLGLSFNDNNVVFLSANRCSGTISRQEITVPRSSSSTSSSNVLFVLLSTFFDDNGDNSRLLLLLLLVFLFLPDVSTKHSTSIYAVVTFSPGGSWCGRSLSTLLGSQRG